MECVARCAPRCARGAAHHEATLRRCVSVAVDNDPHFVVALSGIPDGVCFDLDGAVGDVFQLVYDPVTGSASGRARVRV